MSNKNTGSTWIKCDLHIHSSASYDYKKFDVTNQQLVDKLKKENISLASITDHWSIENVEEIRTLAKNLGVTILPGFEFKVDKGDSPLHAIALFPEDFDIQSIRDNVLNQFSLCEEKGVGVNENSLRKLGEKRLGAGKSKEAYLEEGLKQAYVHLKEAIQVIKSNGGLVYLHYDKSNGLDQISSTTGSQLKIDIHSGVDFFDISSADTVENSLKHKDVIRLTGGQAAGIISSDAHSLEEIGTRYSWIKAKPTFKGLQQILYEPDSRICLDAYCPKYVHYRLDEMSLVKGSDINGKYCFQELTNPISFSPNLTSIIGSRGSGKSTLAELIAYVYDLQTKSAMGGDTMSTVEFHQKQCPDLKVGLSVISGEDEYKTERSLNQDIKTIQEDSALAISVDYWPQGKIERIAKDKNKVSSLMYEKLEDIHIKENWEKVENLLDLLGSKRQDYIQKYKLDLEKIKIDKELKEIELYFKKLKSPEFQALYKKLQELYKNKRSVTSYLSTLDQYTEKITEIKTNLSSVAKLTDSELEDIIPSLKGKLYDFNDLLVNSLETTDKQVLLIKKSIEESSEYLQLLKDLSASETEYQQFCTDQGIHLTKEEIKEKRDRQSTLEGLLKQNNESTQQCIRDKSEHGELVVELSNTFLGWEKLNKEMIDGFNNNFSTSQISAVYEPDIKKQVDWVVKQFSDSYGEWRQNTETKIIGLDKFQEDYLKEVIAEIYSKNNPYETLMKGIETGIPPKFGSKFLDNIYSLEETAFLRDVLLLRLKEYAIRGLSIVKYKDKPLESLSFGERCGTLLELVLSSGTRPLIIDQPEDHVDTEFLTKRLIPLIKQKKETRQIILCTRDPNLVVLSDSELVVVLNDENKDDVTEQIIEGAIEDPGQEKYICDILEGGKTAFLKRKERYSSLHTS